MNALDFFQIVHGGYLVRVTDGVDLPELRNRLADLENVLSLRPDHAYSSPELYSIPDTPHHNDGGIDCTTPGDLQIHLQLVAYASLANVDSGSKCRWSPQAYPLTVLLTFVDRRQCNRPYRRRHTTRFWNKPSTIRREPGMD